MTTAARNRYFQSRVRLSRDPLTVAAQLASAGLHEEYVVYENRGQWCYAGGALAELSLDRAGARMRHLSLETVLPWDGAPLQQVRDLLEGVQVDDWRAYGWAAFELAYAKDGDVGDVGDQRLLHLIVPRTEVRLAGGEAQVRAASLAELARAASVLAAEPGATGGVPSSMDVRRIGADDYQRAVKDTVTQIQDHLLQKVIFSRVVPVDQEIDFTRTYVTGRQGNNPARSFLLRAGGIEAAGFSPETVVQVERGGRVVTQPLAGTRALTGDDAENERLRAELQTDEKEIFEHAISVKAACDDLLGVCTPDSLRVEEFMSVKERGTVQHLASRVAAQLADGFHAWDAFGAAFPAVTASGVPKEAAYTSIRAHESKARGLYSGAVLTVDQDGAMDAALVLRAVYRQNGGTWLQAGAGIVGQSVPRREFEETCEKLDSVALYLTAAP